MTVVLGFEALNGVLAMRDAIDLLETAFVHEAAGNTVVSPRTHVDYQGGSMRILLAADHDAGYVATKAYNHAEGAGVRYVVSLYRLQDGKLLALLDGRIITDLRTGAASGVIARRVRMAGPVTVGIIGSGNQARAQLESIAAAHPVQSAVVYSPSAAHRDSYAREMSAKLGFPVTAVDSAEAAVRSRKVVATATRSRSAEPVVRGEWLADCRLLCAVGNTRKQFSEADVRCFRDAAMIVVDSPNAYQATGELVDAAAAGAVPESKRATLAQIVSGTVTVPEEGLIAFKSVGTALEDLALAARYYEILGSRAGLPSTSDLASLR
jgi:alanine dehydrogenase